MPRKSSKSISRKKSHKLKIGSVVSFYNLKDKCKVNKSIKGFIKRSNKKGRDIKIAYATDNGTKVYRIVENKKRSTRH